MRKLVAAAAVLLSSPAVAVPLRIGAREVRLGPPDETVVRIVAERADATTEPVVLGTALGSLVGGLVLDLPSQGIWRLGLEAEGLWAPEEVVTVAEVGGEVRFELFPTSPVSGRLRVPLDRDPPEHVRVRFQSVPEAAGATVAESRVPRSTVDCPVVAAREPSEGTWRCSLPVGLLDIKLSVPGFVPAYRWGVEVTAAGDRVSLGEVSLAPGASVAGWVLVEGGVDSGRDVPTRVRLLPWLAGRPTRPGDQERLAATAIDAAVSEEGFFQASGVRPGAYRIVASRAGYAEARVGPIDVYEARESELLEPVVLRPPSSLAVRIEPATDPYGRPWELVLQREDDPSGRSEGRSEGQPDGSWEVEELEPGPYRLLVLDADGNRWVHHQVEVEPGRTTVELAVPLIALQGTLRRGGEPVASGLWFGGSRGSRRVRFETDEDGEFVGFLPRPGRWRVSLDPPEGSRLHEVDLPPVEVDPDEDGVARVKIEIPDTRLEGEVVDSEGRGVAGAFVRVVYAFLDRLDGGTTQAVTDEAGEFVLEGLPAGVVLVEAREGSRSSSGRSVSVEEGSPTGPLRLVLAEERLLTGTVISDFGPVPGARVLASPKGGGPGNAHRVTTGADGRFEFAVGADAAAVDLVVLPPGFAARMVQVPLAVAHEPLKIRVDRLGGGLRLVLPDSPLAALLTHGGASVHSGALGEWGSLRRRAEASELVLGRMEPGDYALCFGVSGLGGDPCVRGTLQPGGELVLELPPFELPSLEGARVLTIGGDGSGSR